jgi:hypothetical protein
MTILKLRIDAFLSYLQNLNNPSQIKLHTELFSYIDLFIDNKSLGKVLTPRKYKKLLKYIQRSQFMSNVKHNFNILTQLLFVVVQQQKQYAILSKQYKEKCDELEKLKPKQPFDVNVNTQIKFARKFQLYFERHGVPECLVFNNEYMEEIERYIKEHKE